ncbi:hypothetical protein [Bordetella sp. LUAb4]|uniref:hypothetical protein n=1 Tax=Bordetella sp. LUAb4 TaxID=2843195 RepID=UPI001E515BF7|nr:hypothetical protein [Bordetella sp. LUAb4]
MLLDQRAWDLVLDASGNWAVADEPYAMAQDVASAVRLFLGELYYDTTKGVPYFEQILGAWPPESLIRTQIERAAMTVPGVAAARCVGLALQARTFTGLILVTDSDGAAHNVTF